MKYCCYTVNDKTYMLTVYWDLSQCRENFTVLLLTIMKTTFSHIHWYATICFMEASVFSGVLSTVDFYCDVSFNQSCCCLMEPHIKEGGAMHNSIVYGGTNESGPFLNWYYIIAPFLCWLHPLTS